MASSGLVPFARMRDISAERCSLVMVSGMRALPVGGDAWYQGLSGLPVRINPLPKSGIHC